MFKVGEFSKLSQVTVKALRHYDAIDLFKPSHVDRFTGYRHYTVDQLPRLNRIVAFRELGFSLEQIAELLRENLPPDQLRGMFRLKQAELQRQMEVEQTQLARVAARLRQIELEGQMSKYDVVVKKVAVQKVVAVRDVVPTYADCGRLFNELFAFLGPKGLHPAGPPLAVYHDEEYKERDVDVEAALPVAEAAPANDRVTLRELPAVETMATLIHHGPYEEFSQAYAALMTWIQQSGYRIVGPNREIYLRGPEGGIEPASYVTEIQVPVEKG